MNIVWFKRDLRIGDHRPLAHAAERGAVLPLYIVEPELWRQPDVSARHWHFIAQSLGELDASLTRLGQPLVVCHDGAVATLERIRLSHGIAALWSHEETGNGWTFARDRAVAAWAGAHAVPWYEIAPYGVVRRLASRNGWAHGWDRRMAEAVMQAPAVLTPLPGFERQAVPSAHCLGLGDDGCTDAQTGGRRAGQELLQSFLAGRGRSYRRDMSNPLAGAECCSRLSPHLAWGTVSVREVAQATWARLLTLAGDETADAKALRASLRSFLARLHWHCHFIQKLESEPSIEFTELHPALRGLRPQNGDSVRLEAWASGHTGYPFLDACMRSLRETGWLNFRMRAMVMSFASYNLWLPWRETGLHLARMFTDYEPGIHWPQVQMQSGTTGINTIRMYSVVKQGYDQDPAGAFVRRYVPELAGVPSAFLHEPWAWEGASRVIGCTYPARIVEEKSSSAAAKAAIFAARVGPSFRAAAAEINRRHGSRKSGVAMNGRGSTRATKSKSKSKPKASSQMEFDL